MAKLVENVYGDALFELAIEQGIQDQIFEECKAVAEVLASNDDLLRIMNHPKIVKDEKLQVVENVFKGRVSNQLMGLLTMLVQKDHFKETGKVLDYIVNAIKEYKHIGTASVVSAVELTNDQKNQVVGKLLETTSYEEFEIDYSVDPELIGGMVIRIKDRVVDSSIKTKIAEVTKELSKIQLKVGESAP